MSAAPNAAASLTPSAAQAAVRTHARVHESLRRAFDRHRLVFWYDATGEWAEAAATFVHAGVERLTVAGNAFGTKVRIVRAPDPAQRFLVYVPAARPDDAENWLLDLVLQGHAFHADRASLDLDDAGLPQHDEFRALAAEHAAFFRSARRADALRELAAPDDTVRDVRRKMMAVLAGTPAEVDALVLRFLDAGPATDADPVAAALGPARLTDAFWREASAAFGYAAERPSLRDLAVRLFRGANPLDAGVVLAPHARVFLRRWKDSQAHRDAYRAWAGALEAELRVATALDAAAGAARGAALGGTPGGAADPAALGESDTFELFERYTLQALCQAFDRGAPAAGLRAVLHARRGSFWYDRYADGYEAVAHAVALRELVDAADLALDTVPDGVRRYAASWWRVDQAYRRCTYHLRRFQQPAVAGALGEWADRTYANRFLLPLADRWGDRVRALDAWACEGVTAQHRFYETYVQPFVERGQKVVVVVSDALRYEAAAEWAARLGSANRWSAEVEPLFGALPSYTQLGMAALLPGDVRALDPATATVTVDGLSATGTDNRAALLARAPRARATAVQAEAFAELNSKTDGRALLRDHDVVYVYHNVIDKTGDALATEARTVDAVAQALDELDGIVRKVANLNGTNILVTADHGFLFQQHEVGDADMAPLPAAEALLHQGRRFVLGRGIAEAPGVKRFSARALGVGGNWEAAFPLGLGRFPQRGSGKRYVHGGVSLQEVVVPVVRVRRLRADDAAPVEVDWLRAPSKVTTGQLAVSLFQDRPAVDKVQPRTLRVGLFAVDGTALSELRTVTFDARDPDPRQRETTVVLVLAAAAERYNNQDAELRLEETVAGTSQLVTYRAHPVRLQRSFTSDFDEF